MNQVQKSITNKNFTETKQRLLEQLPTALRYLLPRGKFQYNKFYIGDVDGNVGRSLVVELAGDKAGLWHDFATGQGGHILELWGAIKKLRLNSDILLSAQQWLGIPHPATASAEVETSAAPKDTTTTIDEFSETSRDFGQLTGTWHYLDVNGNVIATVSRYDTSAGKQFRPYDVRAGKYKAPEPRPLYNLPGIKTATTVIVVEGEKAAQALIDAGFCATTAMFGANAPVGKTDWSPLRKKDILIWPDNDEPGKKHAQAVAERLKSEDPYAIAIVNVPNDKPDKWDAADAVIESENINALLRNKTVVVPPLASLYSGGHAADKTDPGPDDLVYPSILTEGGLCVIGGAPKIGKSDFLLHWLVHMSMGLEFMGMKPSRPLRIAYIQVEVRYHAMCKRIQSAIQSMNIGPELIELFRQNLFFTPHMKLTLDQDGVDLMRRTILHHCGNNLDVIAIDPLRYVFDGGKQNKTENDNSAMSFFLQHRLDVLRDGVNPNAANILVHHTRKIAADQLEDEGMQAWAGAGTLHGRCSTAMLMCRPDKQKPQLKVIFELRDGEPIASKLVQKINNSWVEVQPEIALMASDTEHERTRDTILQIIRDEAEKGNVYTMNQLCEVLSHRNAELGVPETIRRKLNTLTTNGYIKFFYDGPRYGLSRPIRTKYGYLCVENMKLSITITNEQTGETTPEIHAVEPSHFKCRKSGEILPVENPKRWEYFAEENS